MTIQPITQTHPELASEWHKTRNTGINPFEISRYCRRKVWWQCGKDKVHIYEAIVYKRAQGDGCPFCGYFLKIAAACSPFVDSIPASEWNHLLNGKQLPTMIVAATHSKWWQRNNDTELAK